MAEWLRRLTRNQIPSGSVGSNPTDCETIFFLSSPAIIWVSDCIREARRDCLLCLQRWFSGRMLACHAGGPGSIPGRCKTTSFFLSQNMGITAKVSYKMDKELPACGQEKNPLEAPGIDPGTSRMLSERSTI